MNRAIVSTKTLVISAALLLFSDGEVLKAGSGSAAEPRPSRQSEAVQSLARLRALIAEGQYPQAEEGARTLLLEVENAEGKESREVATVLDVLVEALWRGGKVNVAESRQLAERALRIKEKAFGPEDPEVAYSLHNMAFLLYEDGRYAEAQPLFERALAIRERRLGPEHPDVAQTLNGLANLLSVTGRNAEAKPLYERALAIFEKAFGSEHRKVAMVLVNLAALLRDLGHYVEAKPLYERALAIDEKLLGADHPEVAIELNNLAALLHDLGDYAAAKPLYERALAINERALGPGSPDVAFNLENLGRLTRDAGDLVGAKPLFERALAIREQSLGPEHPFVAEMLRLMADLFHRTGDYTAARSHFERALAIQKKAYDADNPDEAITLDDFGLLVRDMGHYLEARGLFERALAIREKTLGPDHRDVSSSLENLAWLFYLMGDFAEARPLYERALAIQEKALGADHPWVASTLNDFGLLLSATGDQVRARGLHERALAIRERALGPDHIAVSESLDNLASMLRDAGDAARARSLYERAMTIEEKALGPDHPRLAYTLHGLADCLSSLGEKAEARRLHERALAIREKALGPDHPDVAWSLLAVVSSRWAMGEIGGALETALRAEAISRQHLDLTSRALSEREALRYAAVRPAGLDIALSLAAQTQDPGSIRSAWDALIRSRAIVLDEMASRHGKSSLTTVPAERFASASERLANLVVRGPGDMPPETYRNLVDEARRNREEAERALAEKSAEFRQVRERGRIGMEEVAAALPTASSLVAFAQYDRYEIPGRQQAPDAGDSGADPKAEMGRTSSYAAFVMTADQAEPHLVQLGTTSEIDSLVSRWREEVARGKLQHPPKEMEADYRGAGEVLRRKVWDPIAAHLGKAPRVFVVLDGALGLVNLAALPVGADKYLVETGPLIHNLSTERDIVSPATQGTKARGLLALGGPAFDDITPFATVAHSQREPKAENRTNGSASTPYRGERSGCGDFRSLRFEPLPASAREVEEIAALWKNRHGKNERQRAGRSASANQKQAAALRLFGTHATEAALKAQAPGREVVHLATHSFFLGGKCASALDATHASGRSAATAESQAPMPVAGENPLLLSGLALAGANNRALAGPEDEDGILTAEEIAAMDLSGVQWVVLSACDTGVGEFRAGEGMFGLRRAFQVAGARTVIMSLWSVEDEATRAWMRNLYQERLGGASTAEAVRKASLRVIENLERSGLPAHPYFWAAFVAVGDWR